MSSLIDPINDPENEDFSEVQICRHCQELIRPGTEDFWNGWSWHSQCVPQHVTDGREDEARADERRGK